MQTTQAIQTTESNENVASSKEQLHLGWHDYVWPLAFMLSASLTGLHFPLGYLGILLILVRSFTRSRADFVIQLTLLIGGYSLTTGMDLYLPVDALVVVISLIVLVLFRKNRLLQQIMAVLVFYALAMFVFMLLSDESLAIQYRGYLIWQSFFYFIIPVAAYSRHPFDARQFMIKLYPYAFIYCWYYIIDAVIFSGPVLLPRDSSWVFSGVINMFYDLTWAPLSFNIVRMWPQGLYIFILLLYPTMRYFKLSKTQWALVVIALLISRTVMFTLGLLLCALLLSGNFKRVLKYAGLGLGALVVLYFVDSEPYQVIDDSTVNDEAAGYTSTLRISSTVKQFTDLTDIQDETDLAKFGTNRMAQIIPKWQLLYELGREWIGFGWLSKKDTKMSKYIIDNEFVDNTDESEEVAIGVEMVPVNIILTVGFLGLIIHIGVFVMLLWLIRRLKYFAWPLSVMCTFAFIGLSGLSGLVYIHGLYMSALIYGITIVANRSEIGGFAAITRAHER